MARYDDRNCAANGKQLGSKQSRSALMSGVQHEEADLSDTNAARAALGAYREAERAAYNSSDMGILSLFAEDVMMSACGMSTLKGREAVRDFYVVFWRENTSTIVEALDEEVDDLGAHVIAQGRFRVEIRAKSGGPTMVREGRYLSIFRKRPDGGYELWREAGLDKAPCAELTP
ncbi:MAG: hypothetical protein NTZ79_04160 [Proteobacteria bacterium]|nr:hypothetical protein [Pseudomonadota bacterium]